MVQRRQLSSCPVVQLFVVRPGFDFCIVGWVVWVVESGKCLRSQSLSQKLTTRIDQRSSLHHKTATTTNGSLGLSLSHPQRSTAQQTKQAAARGKKDSPTQVLWGRELPELLELTHPTHSPPTPTRTDF